MDARDFLDLTGETNAAATAGSAISDAKTNQKVLYSNDVMKAAEKRFYFLDAVNVVQLPKGHKDYVVQYMERYLGSTGITFDSGEKAGSRITSTAMNMNDGVTITPSFYSASTRIEHYTMQITAYDILEAAKEQFLYAEMDKIDKAIATGIGDATKTTSTVAGATMLYGGDAYSDATLANGDVLTPEKISDAIRYLNGTDSYYWNSSTWTKGSGVSNGYANYQQVLFIGWAQLNALQKDSQFTNAAEYGSQEVVLNGEVGKYLNVKVVVTSNVESVASGSTGPDATTASADMTRCILCVPEKAYTFVWGIAPYIVIEPINVEAATAVVLQMAYAGSVVYHDSIVFIDVADRAA